MLKILTKRTRLECLREIYYFAIWSTIYIIIMEGWYFHTEEKYMATQKEEAGHSGIFLYPRPDNWCVSAPSPDHDFGLVEINICRIFVDSHLRMWEFHCSVGFFSLAFFLLHFLLSNQQRDLKDQLSYVLKVEPGNHQWFNKWRLREKKNKSEESHEVRWGW